MHFHSLVKPSYYHFPNGCRVIRKTFWFIPMHLICSTRKITFILPTVQFQLFNSTVMLYKELFSYIIFLLNALAAKSQMIYVGSTYRYQRQDEHINQCDALNIRNIDSCIHSLTHSFIPSFTHSVQQSDCRQVFSL